MLLRKNGCHFSSCQGTKSRQRSISISRRQGMVWSQPSSFESISDSGSRYSCGGNPSRYNSMSIISGCRMTAAASTADQGQATALRTSPITRAAATTAVAAVTSGSRANTAAAEQQCSCVSQQARVEQQVVDHRLPIRSHDATACGSIGLVISGDPATKSIDSEWWLPRSNSCIIDQSIDQINRAVE